MTFSIEDVLESLMSSGETDSFDVDVEMTLTVRDEDGNIKEERVRNL